MTPNRNDPCACGSGRKAKNCCMRPAVAPGKNNLLTIPPMEGAPARQVSVADAISIAQELHKRHLVASAETIYKLILIADPENGVALVYTGLIRHEEKKFDEALSLMHRGIAKRPDLALFRYMAGRVYETLERYEEAIALYQHAIALDPKYMSAHNSLGLVYFELGNTKQAIQHLQDAVNLQSPYWLVKNLISTLNYSPDLDPHAVFEMHKKYAQQFERTIARFAPAPMRNWQVDSQTGSHRPIRIGYVSPDFRQHAVANFIEPVLAHHDKSKFELYCYSNQPTGDEVTARIQTLVPNWRVIANMSEHDAARKIQEDQIDILVDLAGHTNQNSLMVFARKPAPVQATWLGYVNTTGLSSIDYRISDVLSEPPEIADEIYSEKLVRLPDCFTCFLPHTKSPDVGPLPAQQSGEIMFGSFNYFVKMNHEVLDTWARILSRVAHSRLTLKYRSMDSPSIQAVVFKALEKHGVARDRVVFLTYDEYQTHLAHYNKIDIALDTFPHNGDTTSCDALWMGVPVITLAGQSHAGLMGVSRLTNVGLPQLIAKSKDDYVDIAVALANDLPQLAQLRSGLRERVRNSPFMDAPRFTRNLEAAYEKMWATHLERVDL